MVVRFRQWQVGKPATSGGKVREQLTTTASVVEVDTATFCAPGPTALTDQASRVRLLP